MWQWFVFEPNKMILVRALFGSICFMCLFNKLYGFAKVVISANLNKDIPYTAKGWQKITTWVTPEGTGHTSSAASISNGDFKAESAGLYNVFTTLTFSGAENGLFKTKVVINNDKINSHPGMVSVFRDATNFHSLSVFGTVRLQPENTLSVYAHSDNDTNWTIIGSSESILNIEFVGFFGYIPGFSGYLSTPHSTNGEKTRVTRWIDNGISGLFRSGTGFSSDLGTFIAICDGVYQISANVRISNEKPGNFQMAFTLNGDDTGTKITHEEIKGKSTFSLFLSLSLYLSRAMEVDLVISGDGPLTIETDSSYSTVQINKGSMQGFSTIFFTPVEGSGRGWVNIPLPKPTTGYGQFQADPDSISTGKFYHRDRELFTVSGIINIEATSTSGTILTLHSDGAALTALRTGVFTTKQTGKIVSSYSIAGILELPADTPLQLFIYLGIQESYKVLSGTRISVAVSQQDYQALHLVQAVPNSFSVSNAWKKLENLRVDKTKAGSYSFTSNLNNNQYVAGVTGVYYLSANIIFQDSNGPISIIISLNGDTSRRRSLYATKGNPASVRDSLSVAGPLYIKKGDTVAVYAMVDRDVSWSVSDVSSFSAVFFGQISVISGVSCVCKRRQAIEKEGWTQIKNWLQPEGNQESMFSSGPGFYPEEGNYVAPLEGLYLVSASIKIQDGSAQGSSVLLNIALDGSPASFTDQNGLQDYVEHLFSPAQNDFYSLTTYGVLKARAGQNISISLNSKGDSSYSLSQDSHFSVLYLSPLDSIYASGSQMMLSESISQIVKSASGWKKLLNWKTSRPNTAPGIFKIGSLIDIDSEAGHIFVLESGIYSISVSITIKATYTSSNDITGDFELALFTRTGIASLRTKYTKTARTVTTMKLYGLLYLTAQQALSIRVQSSTPGANWENLRSHCSLSIVRLPRFTVPPSAISGITKSYRLPVSQGFWSRLKHWNVNFAQTQELSGKAFFGEEGFFTAHRSGVYLVSTSLTLSSNETDFFVRAKIGLNGDLTIPGDNKIDSSKGGANHVKPGCLGKCTIQMAILLAINNGESIGVYVNTDAAYLDLLHSSSFTLKYLMPLYPIPYGFSMQLKEPLSVDVYGDKQLVGWKVDRTKGQFIRTFGEKDEYLIDKAGLYFVAVNIEMVDVEGKTKVVPSLNNIPALSATYFAEKEETFTISISSVMEIQAGSVFTVITHTGSDQSYKVSDLSTSSIVYIGETTGSVGFTSTRNTQDLLDFRAYIWTSISRWSTSGKDFLFETGGGFESKNSYIVQESGLYYCSINIILSSVSNATTVMELTLVHNNINNLNNGLYARKTLKKGGVITLQATGGIYLSKWDYLTVDVRSSETVEDIVFQQESTFSIIKIGEDLSSMACSDNGPNIVGKIFPFSIRLERTSKIKWDCFATGNQPKYQWTKDFKAMKDATGTQLELTDLETSDTGKYVCTATAGGITAASNIAVLTVFEPLPVFINNVSEYTVITEENGPETLDLLKILVKAESTETDREMMNLKLVGGDPKGQFKISPTSSNHGTTLSRIKRLDREDISTYSLVIEAVNVLRPKEPVQQIIIIEVSDLNDNAPIFVQQVYNVTLPENKQVGTHVIKVGTTDADIGENAIIKYFIIPGTAKNVFAIDPASGDITLTAPLDREAREEYVLFIEANDGNFKSYTELDITISDINEHNPFFLQTEYILHVKESVGTFVPILHLLAKDKDSGNNAKLNFTIISGDPQGHFVINEMGELSAQKPLDYETNSSYHLTVVIQDSGNPPRHGDNNATVQIIVLDTNDNRPQFTLPEYIGYIKENSRKFENSPFFVKANDPDGGTQHVSYKIREDGNITDYFTISHLTGIIQMNIAPDFEERTFFKFTVKASDNNGLDSVANVIVRVLDQNDNRPVFKETFASILVPESISNSRIIYTVEATDGDSDENGFVTYYILDDANSNFNVNPYSGAVTTEKSLDRETTSFYTLNITARDSAKEPLYSLHNFFLQITVTDTNDNRPKFDQSEYKKDVKEDTPVGSDILKMTVTDSDLGVNGEITVVVFERSFREVFDIVKKKDNEYHLILLKELNYEDKELYQFTISATDKGTPTLESSVSVRINVVDVNDNRPKFQQSSYATTLIDNAVANQTFFQVIATDADPGGKLTYKIVEGDDKKVFKIDKHVGILQTAFMGKNKTFDPSYRLKIKAYDGFDPPLESDPVELFIRITHQPTIRLTDITIGAFQFETKIHIGDFSHLREVNRLEIAVQQYHVGNTFLNTYGDGSPATWYTVFKSKSSQYNYLRRYIAHQLFFPLKKEVRIRRSTAFIGENDTINVIIGKNMSCIDDNVDDNLICNGPLAAGLSYRVQVRVYEVSNPIPIDSHFSTPISLSVIPVSKATLQEPVSDGMLALASTFVVLYCLIFLVIVIYVCWKRTHEVLNVDHLRDNRGQFPVTDHDRFSPLNPSTSFFSPRTGRIQRMAGYETAGLWPNLSMTETNQILQRSEFFEQIRDDPGLKGDGKYDEIKYEYNNGNYEDDEWQPNEDEYQEAIYGNHKSLREDENNPRHQIQRRERGDSQLSSNSHQYHPGMHRRHVVDANADGGSDIASDTPVLV